MSLTVKINGSAVSIVKTTLSINNTLGALSICSFDIDSLDASTWYALDDTVTVEDGATLIFGGTIKDIFAGGLAGELGMTRTNVQAVDFNALADRRTVFATFESHSLKSRLQGLMTYLSAYGVTLSGSQVTGPTVASISILGKKLTEVLNDLSVESGYVWEISAAKVLQMFVPGTAAAAFNITVAAGNYLRDLTIQRTRLDYANRIVLLAGGDQEGFMTGLAENNRYAGPGTTSGSFRYWDLYPPGKTEGYPFNGGISVLRSGALSGLGLGLYRQDNTDYQYSHGQQEPYGRAVAALSPTDYWKLLEIFGVTSATDAGSGAHNGTYVGYQPTSYFSQLKIGWRGYKFDDTAYISLPSVAASTTTFTVAFFYQPDAAQIDDHGGIFKQIGTKGVSWKRSTGKLAWFNSGFQYSTRALAHGVNYHVVISCTAGTASVYINGILDSTWTGLTSFTPDRIGDDNNLRGLLSDVAYWSGTALTQSQVSDLYNVATGLYETRIYQKTSVTVLASTDWISLEYRAQYPIRLIADDAGEQATYGVREKLVVVPEIDFYSAALTRTNGELSRAIQTPRVARYPTRTSGLFTGRLQNINVTERNINANFTISSIIVREDEDGVLRYDVTATEGTVMPTMWQNTVREWGGAA